MTDIIPYSIIPLKELLKGNEIEEKSVVAIMFVISIVLIYDLWHTLIIHILTK
jgi:hypothetical protein